MKFLYLALSLFAPTSFAALQPDLRTYISLDGSATRLPSGEVRVPVLVSVTNAGSDTAGRFKMGLFYIHNSFPGSRPTGYSSIRSADGAFTYSAPYAWTTRAIFPGRTVSFRGVVALPKGHAVGSQVMIQVQADTCAGEEFMPSFCRVEELSELNNISSPLIFRLP